MQKLKIGLNEWEKTFRENIDIYLVLYYKDNNNIPSFNV